MRFLLAIAFLGAMLANLWPPTAEADDRSVVAAPGGLSAAAVRGRAIYHRGEGGEPPVRLVLSSSDLELPASAFPCSNCHGANGQGTVEGGVAPPAIRWRELMAPARSPLTDRTRVAHDRVSLGRSITGGVDPAGEALHPGMPRYLLTDSQLDDLISYLEVLDTENDLDPGVTPTTIRLGCFLPLSGDRAPAGDAVRRALDGYFADLAERGGVYGRQIEMVYTESGNDDESAVAAARRLIEDEGVFALIGCFSPIESPLLHAYLEESRVPLIGPLSIPPRPNVPPDRYVFELLSSHYDQARVLVEFAATAPELPKTGYALVWIDGAIHRDARAGVVDQIATFGGAVAVDLRYEGGSFEAENTVEALIAAQTEAVLMFGAQQDLIALAEAMRDAGVDWALLTTGSTLGRAAFQLPAEVGRRTYLTYPSAQPTAKQLDWVLQLARRRELTIDHPTLQGPALAAAKIFIEGVKRTGSRLGREVWIEAIEKVQLFETGLVPPVTFGLNQRTGALGSFVLRLDPEKQSFSAASPWITPRAPHRSGAMESP